MRLSDVMEDYLKAIYHLQADSEERIRTKDIAGELDVTSPSVTSMLDKLEDQGLVEREKYQGVRLTETGETIALEVIRHHRLLETFLTEQLDYNWSEVHEEADRLEHHISEDFVERIAATLGYPDIDPHGDPIPNVDLEAPDHPQAKAISDCDEGERVVVERVSDRDPEVLEYLANRGLEPGTEVHIEEIAPFGMITVRPANAPETISLPELVARYVWVTTASPAT